MWLATLALLLLCSLLLYLKLRQRLSIKGFAVTVLEVYKWFWLAWLRLRGRTPEDELEKRILTGQVRIIPVPYP